MRKLASKQMLPAGVEPDVEKHSLVIRYKTTITYILQDG